MKWTIFAGRFQPFHHGHFQVMKQTVSFSITHGIIVLATIGPSDEPRDVLDADFHDLAHEQHLPDRNPWPIPTRLMAINAIADCFRRQNPEVMIATTALPRPDSHWVTVCSWLPGERTWVIPQAGEEFDEQKVKFFQERGDQVIRFIDETGISGYHLRKLLFTERIEELKRYIPECVHRYYLESEYRVSSHAMREENDRR